MSNVQHIIANLRSGIKNQKNINQQLTSQNELKEMKILELNKTLEEKINECKQLNKKLEEIMEEKKKLSDHTNGVIKNLKEMKQNYTYRNGVVIMKNN